MLVTYTHTCNHLTALYPGLYLQSFDAVGWVAGKATGL